MLKVLRLLARTVIVVVGLVAVLVTALLVDHSQPTTLPVPTGEFSVGRTMRLWKDSQQTALLAPGAAPRELVAWIWYPAEPASTNVPRADYFPERWRAAIEHKRGTLITKVLTRDLSKVRVSSRQDIAVAKAAKAYAVVFLRAGAAAFTLEYSSLAEDLASHGYIVVGFDAPYRTALVVFPDGRVIDRAAENDLDKFRGAQQRTRGQQLLDAWAADTGFAIEELTQMNVAEGEALGGKMDLQRIGIVGHSLGGALAAHFCSISTRCKAGIDIDGDLKGSVPAAGIEQPFMFIVGDHDPASEEDARIVEEIRSVFDTLPPDGRSWIRMSGANHFSFSDDAALLKSPLIRRVLSSVGVFDLSGQRQIAATAYCVRTFFDAHLSTAAGSVRIDRSTWPELREER